MFARVIGHIVIIGLLTIVTQIGGLAWLLSRFARWKLATFGVIYASMTLVTPMIAPLNGRIALSCFESGPLQMQSTFYCVLNRNYMRPELLTLLQDAATQVSAAYPGTQTLVLDASFPFFDGFPLLPHLSHDDGGQADLTFFYSDDIGYLPGRTPSPIGYFAFEPGPTPCRYRLMSLRWDMAWLQPLWPRLDLEPLRTATLIRALEHHAKYLKTFSHQKCPEKADAWQGIFDSGFPNGALSEDTRTGRLFVEPHLVERLDVGHPRIGFQGCRAARHDDHIHVQL